jgi:hypothetical protein
MGLDVVSINNPFIGLFILFVTNILFRFMAIIVLHNRFQSKYQLQEASD